MAQMSGWDKRNCNYEETHSIDDAAYAALAEAMNINHAHIIMDLMCGYGAAASATLQHGEWPHKFILVDKYPAQLDRAPDYLREKHGSRPGVQWMDKIIEFQLSDAAHVPRPDDSIDKIIIKMGLHEVSPCEQQEIINEVYRMLKPGGELYIWTMFLHSAEERSLFQDILMAKDLLSGLDQLVAQRNWPTMEELSLHLQRFSSARVVYDMPLRFSSSSWLHSDLALPGGEKEARLATWNTYIRRRVPQRQRLQLRYAEQRDYGAPESIQLQFMQGIIKAIK